MNVYGFLADVLVVIHAVWVGVVVFGLLAVLIGAWLGWQWIRDFWFRIVHLGMIGVVVFEAVLGIPCPLTTWEAGLRRGMIISHVGRKPVRTPPEFRAAIAGLTGPLELRMAHDEQNPVRVVAAGS